MKRKEHTLKKYTVTGNVASRSTISNRLNRNGLGERFQEENTFVQTIIENNPDCVKILNTDGGLLYMNVNGLCLMDIDDFAQVKDKSCWELWGRENQHLVKDAVNRAASGEKAQFEAFCATLKGTPKWWDVTLSPLQTGGHNEKPLQILSVSREITERKKLEDILRYRTALLEAQNDASQDGILLVNAEEKILSYNRRFVEIWNMPQEIIDAKDGEAALSFAMTQLVHPEQFVENRKYFYEHPAESGTDELECKDGRFIQRHGFPVIGEDGTYYAWSWNFRDITKERTYQLKESKLLTRFQNLVMHAPAAMCIFRGPTYIVELANEKMLEFWDRKAGQVLNKPVFEGMPDLSGQGFEELLHEVYTTGKRFTSPEASLTLLRNGKFEKVFIKLIYEAMHEDDGTISGVIALAVEITEVVVIKNKIEESNQRYNLMLMQSPFAFSVMKGKDKVVTLANNLMKEIWGKGEDVEGKTLLQILPELKDQPFPGMIDSVYTTGDPVYANEMLARLQHNGKLEYRYFNIVYQPHREADETISGVITIAHEVTNQVLARKTVEESEHRYQELIYSSPSLIAILKGQDNIITIANDAIVEIWGKGKDVIGKPFFQALPELIEQNIEPLVSNVYTSGIPYQANEMPVSIVRYGKAELRYYSYVFQPQRSAAGAIEGVAIIGAEVTSQAILNNKIKESEERFRSLADNIPMMTFIIEPDEEGAISYWNKTWLDYTGQTFEEAIGRAWYGIVHPDDIPGVMDVYVPALQKREPYLLPAIRVKRHDGEYRWHTFKSNPRFMPNGEFMGYIGVGSDIHESKLAVDALKESEERFRNLVEKATSPICILKGEDMILEVANEPVFKVWNVGKEALGKPFLEIIPEMKDQPFMGYLLDVYRNGVTHYGNEEPAYFTRNNGEKQIIYFNFVYQPYRESDGNISGVMVLATDVTEQVVARKQMEVQAVMVKELLRTAPGFICTLDGPDHVYTIVNERYQQLFGKRKIQGKALLKALPELEGQGFNELLDQVYTTGQPYVGIDIPVTVARDQDLEPELRYFNFSYQPIYNENKVIYSILVFGYEVTDQVVAKNQIMQIQRQNALDLEEKVKLRTVELSEANELLLQRNKALFNMNKELESFTYVSSHDLQEPLRKIQTFANLILTNETALSDKGKNAFLRIQKSAARMQTLIEDLLAYSRAIGKDRVLVKTDLSMLVEEVKIDLEEAIEEKNAVIEMNSLCMVNVNASQFRQMLQNLIGNALKFSVAGSPPLITIYGENKKGGQLQNERPGLPLQRLSPEKDYCHISFIDNGIGFDPQYKDRIFEVFQRLHGREAFAGTGIGLAIVKKIVENHNGFITADSALNKGARFDIYIPVD